ncbi:hypothetical protein [Rhodoferax sp.]|uniref:hypothetical protein n=1 Tax=Rhodoferax sp. TaxID=50421 RepID=UPI002631DD52|nr:hypothetical protein [Rhodoferax sp.]MDD5479506.1 hypothetical protein [Rhodoferax sp.]
MDLDNDDYIPGLHDPSSVPFDVRVSKFEAHLREWVDFDLAVHIAARAQIALKDCEDGLAMIGPKLDEYRSFVKTLPDILDAGADAAHIGGVAIEALMTVSKKEIDRKKNLSTAGVIGANAKHRSIRELKIWALNEAKTQLVDDKKIARYLANNLPEFLKNASKDPQRLIYDALRKNKKL